MITGLHASLHFSTIFFCQRGTISIGTSTPRSPRATIIASVAAMIESIFSSASGFSIFATILQTFPFASIRSRRSRISSADLTKERAIQSTSCDKPNCKSSISFSVNEGALTLVFGRLIPFLDFRIPPWITVQFTFLPSVSFTTTSKLPSSIKILSPVTTS